MMFQFPFPPPPDFPVDPPNTAEQLFACIVLVLLWFETIVLLLPERWRWKISELQFGPSWAAKRKEDQ
jgi:hypothetical protein